MRRVLQGLICFVLLNGMCGCQETLFKRGDKSITLQDVSHAAWKAVISPEVLYPAGGALVFGYVEDWDEEVSSWATENNPIYGTNDTARQASDIMLGVSYFSPIKLWLARPDDDTKEVDGFIGASMMASSFLTTEALKSIVGRERPNEENNKSFPSGHSSGSAVSTSIARMQLERYAPQNGEQQLANTALSLLPYATGWARVEAEKHFPSDVLAGIAIGNFFAQFANNLMSDDNQATLYVRPVNGATMVGLSMPFGDVMRNIEKRDELRHRLRVASAPVEDVVELASTQGAEDVLRSVR